MLPYQRGGTQAHAIANITRKSTVRFLARNREAGVRRAAQRIEIVEEGRVIFDVGKAERVRDDGKQGVSLGCAEKQIISLGGWGPVPRPFRAKQKSQRSAAASLTLWFSL